MPCPGQCELYIGGAEWVLFLYELAWLAGQTAAHPANSLCRRRTGIKQSRIPAAGGRRQRAQGRPVGIGAANPLQPGTAGQRAAGHYPAGRAAGPGRDPQQGEVPHGVPAAGTLYPTDCLLPGPADSGRAGVCHPHRTPAGPFQHLDDDEISVPSG